MFMISLDVMIWYIYYLNMDVAQITLCMFDAWMGNGFMLGRMWGPTNSFFWLGVKVEIFRIINFMLCF